MNTPEIKKHIEIEGIVLTEKAILQIKIFQEHDNYMLKETLSSLADFICLVLRNRNQFVDAVLPKLDGLLEDLANIRDNIEDLAKP